MSQALRKSKRAPTTPATATAKTKATNTNVSSPAPTGTVGSWEDDPETAVGLTVPTPDLSKLPLAFSFPTGGPPPAVYAHGTYEFRYWATAAALRRGADYWAQRVPLTQWQGGPSLNVVLDNGFELDANYNRTGLNFFHGPGVTGTVFTCESPDVSCHEVGHAVLDAFMPELWGVASTEIAAFHESFGDISALMSAIQIPSLRTAVLAVSDGNLYTTSRLSRLAEQLGSALRAQDPGLAEADCLRSAVNSFNYQDPMTLPSAAPLSQLSSKPHSFSRIFTGAFFEILGVSLAAKAANPGAPTETEFLAVADDLAGFLVQGLKWSSPVVTNCYAQVAANMVIAAQADPTYSSIARGVFVGRSILSLQSASSLPMMAKVKSLTAPAKSAMAERVPLPMVGLPASQYGIDGVLFVEAAAEPREFDVTSAGFNAEPIAPQSGTAAAKAFVDDLFMSGQIDYGTVVDPERRLVRNHKTKTHALVKIDGGARLERRLFNCGLCARGTCH
ncbi:hypothetical protein FA04_27655 (plasmid) [Ensifer adhaerens]|uniref:Peptidase M4 C-terminal domain-containing protein n=1 Tax=Ensifer adhaerens TaxID=106592 RepID=A0ABY8HU34_ENSAD|nr:hypothetical protein [Ensifer adhaerens]ANK76529.1 hypothetical protein FA04_27655 [Ensifer adhaerens]KDP74011.1 hypothetical protein FA04_08770 [Ensifer adhaerens]WFP94945.1 hypothetical protein P4B07_28035 [Ensifer adhaerens]